MTSMTPLRLASLPFFFFLLSFLANSNIALSTMNAIDRCWRTSPNWAADRHQLAFCSVGFVGKMKRNRGRGLTQYQVTDPVDDPLRPRPGTLRYGATLIPGKVWITFERDMNIRLEKPLLISSLTTIDGRGADVHIANGAGFLIDHANNVIIHGLQFHHNHPIPSGQVVGSGGKIIDFRTAADGDAIRIVSSYKVWVDHNTLYQGEDGLIDVTRGSTGITISNNWFKDHDKVMLLGHDDGFARDRKMKVTVAFNKFGPNCIQRMPRIRHGYAHVVNNFYDGWKDYAMGGSMNPTIKSQGNLFVASHSNNKAVIWKEPGAGSGEWDLRSVNDAFVNGAHFGQVGPTSTTSRGRPNYKPDQIFAVSNPNEVSSITKDAGALRCSITNTC